MNNTSLFNCFPEDTDVSDIEAASKAFKMLQSAGCTKDDIQIADSKGGASGVQILLPFNYGKMDLESEFSKAVAKVTDFSESESMLRILTLLARASVEDSASLYNPFEGKVYYIQSDGYTGEEKHYDSDRPIIRVILHREVVESLKFFN